MHNKVRRSGCLLVQPLQEKEALSVQQKTISPIGRHPVSVVPSHLVAHQEADPHPYVRTRKISEFKPNMEHSRARPKGGGSLDANQKLTHSKLSIISES